MQVSGHSRVWAEEVAASWAPGAGPGVRSPAHLAGYGIRYIIGRSILDQL